MTKDKPTLGFQLIEGQALAALQLAGIIVDALKKDPEIAKKIEDELLKTIRLTKDDVKDNPKDKSLAAALDNLGEFRKAYFPTPSEVSSSSPEGLS